MASTMLNLILADLSLKETLKVATPRFSISEPPYPLRTLLHGRIVIGNGKCCRSAEVMTQASAPVSTFRLMSWTSLILTLAKILSGWLSRALSEISWVCWCFVEVRVPRNTVMGSVSLVSSSDSSSRVYS